MVVAVLASAVLPAAGAETFDPRATYASALREVWPRGMAPSGSGFHVGAGKVLTAAHVVAGCPTVWARHRGRGGTASLLGLDTRHDVALLDVPSLHDLPRPVFADAVVDRPAVLWGHSEKRGEIAEDPTARPSEVIGLRVERVAVPLLDLDGAAPKGFSGGPVVDEEGAVLGMVVAKWTGSEASVLAVPSDALRRFLLYMDVRADIAPFVAPNVDRRADHPAADGRRAAPTSGRDSRGETARGFVLRVGCSR